MHNTDLHVNGDARPGWIAGNERALTVGEEVYCAIGSGEIAAVLGKVGDGSRLLEIRLPGTGTKPYFAAASNVRVGPASRGEAEAPPTFAGDVPGALPAPAETWLGGSRG